MDKIKPGMSKEENDRVRQEIARLASQMLRGTLIDPQRATEFYKCAHGLTKAALKRRKKRFRRFMAIITSANLANAIVKLVAADALPA
jgi:hypothetical protein